MTSLPEFTALSPTSRTASLDSSAAVRRPELLDAVGAIRQDRYARDLQQVREGECFFCEIGRIHQERIHG